MGTVVLGWDPGRGTRWVPPYDSALRTLAGAGSVTRPWPLRGTAGPKAHGCTTATPPPGTRVHLMLQGRTRGLVGRGVVRSTAFAAVDPAQPATLCPHVLIEWDRLRPIAERIGVEALVARVPEVPWASLYAPVHALTEDEAARLHSVWGGDRPAARPGPARTARPGELDGGQPSARSAAAL